VGTGAGSHAGTNGKAADGSNRGAEQHTASEEQILLQLSCKGKADKTCRAVQHPFKEAGRLNIGAQLDSTDAQMCQGAGSSRNPKPQSKPVALIHS